MATDSDGNGYLPLNLVTDDDEKDYIKVRIVDDTTNKDWMPVQFVDESTKKGMNAKVVIYDSPKDYTFVNDYKSTYTRYYPYFDGTNNYIQINTAESMSIGDTLSFKFNYNSSTLVAYAPIIDSSSSANRICARVGSDGATWDFVGCTATLDGEDVATGDTITSDSDDHLMVITATVAGEVKNIGCNYNQSTSYLFTGYIWNLVFKDLAIPLDDGYISGGVADSVTYYNFSESDFVTAT
jgi:hypothetical protein